MSGANTGLRCRGATEGLLGVLSVLIGLGLRGRWSVRGAFGKMFFEFKCYLFRGLSSTRQPTLSCEKINLSQDSRKMKFMKSF